jgi:hypothetical protein
MTSLNCSTLSWQQIPRTFFFFWINPQSWFEQDKSSDLFFTWLHLEIQSFYAFIMRIYILLFNQNKCGSEFKTLNNASEYWKYVIYRVAQFKNCIVNIVPCNDFRETIHHVQVWYIHGNLMLPSNFYFIYINAIIKPREFEWLNDGRYILPKIWLDSWY